MQRIMTADTTSSFADDGPRDARGGTKVRVSAPTVLVRFLLGRAGDDRSASGTDSARKCHPL